MSSLTRNTIYSFLNQIVLLVIPFITFPYISRVLGPGYYGSINYATSIVAIFAVFAGTGLVGHATREIAVVKDDKEKLGAKFQELFIIQLALTVCMFCLYGVFLSNLSGINGEFLIFLITGLTMLTNLFTFQWFFVGIEEFKYITTRDVVIKIIFVICVFMFVNEKEDYLIYVLLNLGSFILTALLNSCYLIKFIEIKKRNLSFSLHLKPVFLALIISFVSTTTLQLNSILLGSIAAKENLGLYNVGIKMTTMLVAIVSNAFAVLLPRLSYLNSNNDHDSQRKILNKTGHFLGIISIPACVGFMLYSNIIIKVLFGTEYMGAIVVSQITSLCLIIMPLVAIYAYYLYSTGRERISIYAMLLALVINLVANITLTTKYLIVGAAITFVLTELSKLIFYSLWLRRTGVKFNLFSMNYLSYCLIATIAVVLPYLMFKPESIFAGIFIMLGSIIFYFIMLGIVKDKYFIDMIQIIKSMLIRKKRQ
ncbi:flippase [Bacillus cereus]|uniref:flippase n=1 Tax=Bacillus cereus group TaxID=86661 RepID=UPI000945DBA8|nr:MULTISPECIES: flippase [Bacillus cereus group]MCI4057145.1 flippase [Bacillus cereus]